jgi:hypothetical protein
VRAFRAVAGYHPPVSPEVVIHIVRPPADLGTLVESARWDRQRIERWLAQGESDAVTALASGSDLKKNFSLLNCLER